MKMEIGFWPTSGHVSSGFVGLRQEGNKLTLCEAEDNVRLKHRVE